MRDNFGYQWNIFRKTQIGNLKFNVSKTRLLEQTKWKKKNFNNKTITLEAGSGAGRFTQAYLSQFPGKLISIDLSNAVKVIKKIIPVISIEKTFYFSGGYIKNAIQK